LLEKSFSVRPEEPPYFGGVSKGCFGEPTDLKEEPMANQLGKRYLCDTCGTEVLCNKPGTGAVECCGQEMKLKEAKPLPSSD